MPYLLLILALPLIFATVRLLAVFLRDLLVNPVSAVLLLVAMAGFYVALGFGLMLVMGLSGMGLTDGRVPWARLWPTAVTAGVGLLVGNLGYWGRVRWNDYLVVRRSVRMQRQAERLTRRRAARG